MRQHIIEKIAIPSGVECSFHNQTFTCKKSGHVLTRHIDEPSLTLHIQGQEIVVEILKGNKSHLNLVRSTVAHINNLLNGLENEYEYQMDAVNVHFPMTLKVDKDKLIITNFLGEKKTREALILPNVKIDLKGTKLTIKSRNKDSAGQTVANIEKATKVRNRDRRVFQDGIYLTGRPGGVPA